MIEITKAIEEMVRLGFLVEEGVKGFLKALNFMMPYINDKSGWIKPLDIQHFDELPIQSPGLLFADLAYENADFIRTWEGLNSQRKSEEIKRDFPIWEAVL